MLSFTCPVSLLTKYATDILDTLHKEMVLQALAILLTFWLEHNSWILILLSACKLIKSVTLRREKEELPVFCQSPYFCVKYVFN